jgi:hypothetical protein
LRPLTVSIRHACLRARGRADAILTAVDASPAGLVGS